MISPKQTLLILFVLITKILFGQIEFDSKLPLVFIDTKGEVIKDNPRILAELGIVWNENGAINNSHSEYNHYVGNITIEIRGSSSQMFPKKSYGFELKDSENNDMDFPLLGMPEEEDWILYAPYSDKTLIRNALTFSIASQLGGYVPRVRYVELFVNREYMGVYLLMEKIKRDEFRVDIARLKDEDIEGEELTGGYIIKVDKTTGSGGGGWYSAFKNENSANTFYQYDYPDETDIQPEQSIYIQSFINQFESALNEENFDPIWGYTRFIHRESFFNYIFMNEIAKNVDGYRLSTYLFKHKNGKLHAGPIWDFNLGYGNANYYEGWERTGLQMYADLGNDNWQNPFWWSKIMSDPYFKNDLRCKWDSLRKNELSEGRIIGLADSLLTYIADARVRNFEKWPIINQWVWPNYYIGENFFQEIYWFKNWLTERLQWLDFALPGECGEEPIIIPDVEGFAWSLFPNPVKTEFTLQIASDAFLKVRLQVVDLSGKTVYDNIHDVMEGYTPIKVNISNYQKGVYIYRIFKGDNEAGVGKIVKM